MRLDHAVGEEHEGLAGGDVNCGFRVIGVGEDAEGDSSADWEFFAIEIGSGMACA